MWCNVSKNIIYVYRSIICGVEYNQCCVYSEISTYDALTDIEYSTSLPLAYNIYIVEGGRYGIIIFFNYFNFISRESL